LVRDRLTWSRTREQSRASLAARGVTAHALLLTCPPPPPPQTHNAEQSKFLGGDIAHTHLVKGLDYALLQQERSKLETGGSGGGSGSAAAAAASAAAAAAEAAEAAQRQAAQAVSFAGAAGRSLYNAVFRPPPHNRALVRESFQPRRTAFVFEFEDGASDVPTTLRRSKADCPPVQVCLCVSCGAALAGWLAGARGVSCNLNLTPPPPVLPCHVIVTT
jgi:hypothetical protein